VITEEQPSPNQQTKTRNPVFRDRDRAGRRGRLATVRAYGVPTERKNGARSAVGPHPVPCHACLSSNGPGRYEASQAKAWMVFFHSLVGWAGV